MELKKICAKAISLFTASFVLPMGIWFYSENTDKMNKIAKASAFVTLGKKIEKEKTNQIKIVNTFSDKKFKGEDISKKTVWDIDMAQKEIETPSESKEIPSPKPSEEILDALPYPESLENHDGVIKDFTYGTYSGNQYFNLDDGGQVRNCTELSNDDLYNESKKDIDFNIEKNSDKPQILIYHTHTTESFEPYSRDYYDKSFSCKSTDTKMNIVAVGNEICKQLDKSGISYIHDTCVHDYPSYDGAYDSSRATVKKILSEYPSIKICLDIHRDAIEKEDGTRLAPVVNINGEEAAQLMIISGCDDGTMDMPDFRKNFHFASKLQSALEKNYSGITRPILFDYRFYNQDLTTGSLLIEVGSHGNSIDQVKNTGKIIGKVLTKMFG